MFERIGEKLSAMAAIPTVSGKGEDADNQIGKYRAFLETAFPSLFASASVIPVGEALLLSLEGSGRQALPVLFTGHMDVVPADGTKGWSYPPFSGRIADGCVWGRGTQDMKGPQCALLSAFDALLQGGWRPVRDIWLYLSCDEETGGHTTTRAAELLRKKKLHFETVFDEGGTICEDFMGLVKGKAACFGISEKGSLEYRFTALSQGGHSANPPAHSAIVRLADFIHEVEYSGFFRRELSEGNRTMLRSAAPYARPEIREKLLLAADERQSYPVLHEICKDAGTLLGATIAFTMIEGGTAFNVSVPSTETVEEITGKLERAAGKHDLLCELAGGRGAAPESPTDGPGYLAMKASVEEIWPELPVIPFVLGGGTDSRHFLELTDEVLRFSPMYATPEQGRGVHGDNEYASIQAVREAAECYTVLLKKM